jgi:hypothetical protein
MNALGHVHITEKRLDTGDLTESEIIAAVKSYNPA